MIGRWLHGQHPVDGSFGAWMSIPGVDVRSTVDPNLMLISPLKKNEQILMSGGVGVAAGADEVVYYTETLSVAPFVQVAVTAEGGRILYPASRGPFTASATIFVSQYPNGVIFQNRTNVSVIFWFTVCARAG
jgi:hypothetical protein